jgi:hypothetical protein
MNQMDRDRVILSTIFTALGSEHFDITSPQTPQYNCIAWAANDSRRWWHPRREKPNYWPPGVLRSETVASFVAAFSTLGYDVCENGELEAAYEKVVIYVDPAGIPTHMARQLPDGRWASKLGNAHDIEHATPGGVCGHKYGVVSTFLKRNRKSATQ